jgi:hypothetical protein
MSCCWWYIIFIVVLATKPAFAPLVIVLWLLLGRK